MERVKFTYAGRNYEITDLILRGTLISIDIRRYLPNDEMHVIDEQTNESSIFLRSDIEPFDGLMNEINRRKYERFNTPCSLLDSPELLFRALEQSPTK